MQNSTCTFPLITGENVAVCWPCCLKRHFSPTWIINSCIFVSLINTRSVINHLINKSSHPNLLMTALTTKTWMGRWHWRRMRVMVLLSGQCVHGLPPAFWRASKTPAARVISKTGITGDQKLVSSTLKAFWPAPFDLSTSNIALKQWRDYSGPNEPLPIPHSPTRPYCWCWICQTYSVSAGCRILFPGFELFTAKCGVWCLILQPQLGLTNSFISTNCCIINADNHRWFTLCMSTHHMTALHLLARRWGLVSRFWVWALIVSGLCH